MEAQLLLRTPRPLATAAGRWLACSRGSVGPAAAAAAATATLLCQQQRRTKLTTNRMKRALNIPPHPSFLDESGGGRQEDVVIFNPPASEASVYHTPFKFLPKSDPRRRANLASLFAPSSPAASSSADPPVTPESFPALKPAGGGRMVTEAEVHEMRTLRAQDPDKWSVTALARKFDTTKVFVMIATGSKKMTEHKLRMQEELERVKERWGPKRAKAREDRAKRRELLYRGEL